MSDLFSFLPLLRPQAWRFAAAILLGIGALAAGVALLGTAGWFITAAATVVAAAAFNLFGPSSLVRGFSLLRIVCRYGERVSGHDATLRLLADIRVWTFATLVARVPLGRSLRHGDAVSRFTADVDALDAVFLAAMGPLVGALAIGVGMIAMLAWLLPGAALAYGVSFLAASVAVPLLLVAASHKPGRRAVEAAADLRMAVLDGVDGHADLVALGATGTARQTFASSAAGLAAARRSLGLGSSLSGAAVQGLAGAALLLILLPGIAALQAGAISGPVLVGLLLACLGSFEASALLVRNAGRLSAAASAATRLRGIARQKVAVTDPADPKTLPPGSGVTFRKVGFGYGDGPDVLTGIDLTIAPGERVAITGASGGGKSSLLALLLRLADPRTGQVFVADADISSVPLAQLHRRVALLSQDAPVFLDTVRANLLIGRGDADEAAMWQALEAARLADFVKGLPAGLDSWLGEAGRTLSAGQARRLCLARTLLSGADIIALDEPTSGLDPDTERDFLADLLRATSGRTLVLVTHAALPAGAVDRTLRLASGRLAAA